MRSFRNHESGPIVIAGGLGLLIVYFYCGAMPIITAVALIAFGATLGIASRFRSSLALPALIAAHLVVYVSLYLLFVGAVLHAAFAKSTGGLGLVQVLDLALSIGLMVAAVRVAIDSLAGRGDAPAR
jgi:hypothetical protein